MTAVTPGLRLVPVLSFRQPWAGLVFTDRKTIATAQTRHDAVRNAQDKAAYIEPGEDIACPHCQADQYNAINAELNPKE